MAYCPNCSATLPSDAATCGKCGALFGPGSAWRPVSSPDSSAPAVDNQQPVSSPAFILGVLCLISCVIAGVSLLYFYGPCFSGRPGACFSGIPLFLGVAFIVVFGLAGAALVRR